MSLESFYLGIDATDKVEIFPKWDYSKTKKQISAKTRKANGDGEVYKFGDFDYIIIKLENVPSKDRDTLNRYWEDSNQLLFEVNSSGVTDTTSVMLVNPSTPIDEFTPPYSGQYSGKLILSGY